MMNITEQFEQWYWDNIADTLDGNSRDFTFEKFNGEYLDLEVRKVFTLFEAGYNAAIDSNTESMKNSQRYCTWLENPYIAFEDYEPIMLNVEEIEKKLDEVIEGCS